MGLPFGSNSALPKDSFRCDFQATYYRRLGLVSAWQPDGRRRTPGRDSGSRPFQLKQMADFGLRFSNTQETFSLRRSHEKISFEILCDLLLLHRAYDVVHCHKHTWTNRPKRPPQNQQPVRCFHGNWSRYAIRGVNPVQKSGWSVLLVLHFGANKRRCGNNMDGCL